MAWRRTGDKPLFEPMMAYFTEAYMPHSASMGSASHPVQRVLCPKISSIRFSVSFTEFITLDRKPDAGFMIKWYFTSFACWQAPFRQTQIWAYLVKCWGSVLVYPNSLTDICQQNGIFKIEYSHVIHGYGIDVLVWTWKMSTDRWGHQ